MAYEVTLPRLGWDMEEGALGGWLKQNGEFVNAGDMLFTVEGDKAVQEIEALDSGYLHIAPNAPAMGVIVPVGTLLGYLVSEDELKSFNIGASPEIPASPSAIEATIQLASHPANSEPFMATLDIPPIGETRRRVYISPYARRLAEGLEVDWHKVTGSGREGRIMARDIQAAKVQQSTAASAAATVPEAAPAERPAPAPAASRAPQSAVRRRIAEHMANSARTVAPVTLTCEVDATQLVALRRQLKEDLQSENSVVPSYNDMLAKIAAQASDGTPGN